MAAGAWRRLVVLVTDGHNDVRALEELRRTLVGWIGENPGKNVTLVVLHATPSSMSSDERRTMMRLMEETKHSRMASATVVMATGVLGALHRSILTGMNMLVPPPHPSKIVADVPSAARFLAPYLDGLSGPVKADQIEQIAHTLHGRICAAKVRAAVA